MLFNSARVAARWGELMAGEQADQRFIPDAEVISGGRIPDIFRPPPDIVFPLVRNSMLVGSGGAGKTMILRYAETTHDGLVFRLDLSHALAGIPKTASVGPLAHDLSNTIVQNLQGKAIALLSLEVALRLARAGIDVPTASLSDCLPEGFDSGGLRLRERTSLYPAASRSRCSRQLRRAIPGCAHARVHLGGWDSKSSRARVIDASVGSS